MLRVRSLKPPRIIVCEATGRWALGLRREMSGAGLPLEETRTLDDARESLAAAPASLLLVELRGATAKDFLSWLARQQRDFPEARLVVVASHDWEAWRFAVLEAGAVHAVFHPRELAAVVNVARQHLGRTASALPPESESLIWSRLPWPKQPEGAP